VFIVHGHDEANAMRLAGLVRDRWKLTAVVLKDEPHMGRTLIEKFEGEADRATVALVLLTNDDIVNIQSARYLQARPNVFFELGWFFGKLGRDRTILVWKEGGNLPTDLSGIGRVNFTHSVEEAFLELEKELVAVNAIPKPA
jgi:predicted nucleotide-binding protein